MTENFLFDVDTPLEFRVHTTRNYWHTRVCVKHGDMRDRLYDVADALGNPDEVRRSVQDSDVYLFYQLEYPGRYLCVVAKRLNGIGFLMTTYPADYIKEGETLWLK